MNPKADPGLALHEGLYVPSPLSTSAQIATRLELEPASTHLMIGATGSGKSTELFAIRGRLGKVGDVTALFQDVAAVQQLAQLKEGSLVGLAWRLIWADVTQRYQSIASGFSDATFATNIANGFWNDEEWPDDGDRFDWVPGLITPPQRNEDLERLIGYLKTLLSQVPTQYVLLLDGLDRMRDVAKLTSVLLYDLFTLVELGVGSVVVGPPELRGDAYREFNERFATFHFHGATDPNNDDAQTFLNRVLELRAVGELLPASSRNALVGWSGGILRDLIALAKNAGDNAYGSAHQAISESDVNDAADRFGRSLLVGISDSAATRLTSLSGFGITRYFAFTVASADDLDLLLRRLVIEVMEVPPKFFIHPTVRPLLRGLRKAV